jgi:hypothetical protein
MFAKRMNKVENQKVDDSAHLAHASSTLDKSRTIPVDGKWHCVKSESKNITNAEIQRYIREDKGLGDFRIDKVYSARSGIHTTYFKCAFSSKLTVLSRLDAQKTLTVTSIPRSR